MDLICWEVRRAERFRSPCIDPIQLRLLVLVPCFRIEISPLFSSISARSKVCRNACSRSGTADPKVASFFLDHEQGLLIFELYALRVRSGLLMLPPVNRYVDCSFAAFLEHHFFPFVDSFHFCHSYLSRFTFSF